MINMKKRFKAKRKPSLKRRFILFIILIIISFFSVFNLLYKNIQNKINDKDIVNYLLFNKYSDNYYDLINLNSTEFLVKYSLGIDITNNKIEPINENLGDYVEDPSPDSNSLKPLIYIYNTHQTEAYNKQVMEAYNISPTVMITSYMLRERLNDLGINTVVETKEIKQILNANNWIYSDSYKASRILLNEAIKENPSLEIFIDIHRDSSIYQSTTYMSDGKSYAKCLFVVGLDYKGYQTNLKNAEHLNEILKNNNPNISRGIMKKSGNGVNGIYNQDFHNNTFLIEVGGQYNNIDEVRNTIDILSLSIKEYVEELINEKKV